MKYVRCKYYDKCTNADISIRCLIPISVAHEIDEVPPFCFKEGEQKP
jgi:hypothetical protein